MPRGPRYTTVKNLITSGHIKAFREMFPTIRKSVVARDLGMNSSRFTRIMNDVKKFKLEELFRLARFLEIEEMTMLTLVYEQYLRDKGKKIKKVANG